MNRRSFIGLVLGAAAAISLRAARQVEPGVGNWTMLSPDFIPIGHQLSYVTRKSFLPHCYAQIYRSNPFLLYELEDKS